MKGLESSAHLIKGELSGEGPWKIANHVITVTGCEGSDPEMASILSEWQAFLSVPGQDYPNDDEISYLATRMGARIHDC